jgi:hypothetical protein
MNSWLTTNDYVEIVNTIRTLGDEIRAIASKAGQLERDSEEHSSVYQIDYNLFLQYD